MYNVFGDIMAENLKELLISRDILIPRVLFMKYKSIGITNDELIFIIYLINGSDIFNPKQISDDLNLSLTEVMNIVESLTSKGILKLELKKVGNTRNEYINLDGLYSKLTFLLINKEEKKNTTIYDVCESEFGRPITPMEYQIIGAWLDNGTSEETIILAIKEAVYNGTTNLRYIDSIISNWNKKGIKTKEDVEKSRMNFKKTKEKKDLDKEILQYDWLNDE